jgi:hypothetical protein
VPKTQGLVVPASALVSNADNAVGLIDQAGTFWPVEISASAKGVSVVTGDGLAPGQMFRLPAGQ